MKRLFILLALILCSCTLTPSEKTAIPAMLTALPDLLTQIYAGEPTSTSTPTRIITNTFTKTSTSTVTLTKTPTFTKTLTPTFTKTLTPTKTNTLAVIGNIYVDGTNGNDANSGSEANPYKTIQKAVSLSKAGYTIYVKAGTYNESVALSVSGASGSPITLTRFGTDAVTLNGGTSIALFTRSGISYWIIDGLTIRSTNRYTTRFGWWGETATSNIIVRNNNLIGANFMISSYSTFDNNDVSGIGYTATLGDAGIADASTSHHNIISNNKIHDFTSTDSRGIWTQGKTHDSIYENNTVTNIKAVSGIGQCIDLDGASNVEWRHIVRGNKIDGCNYVGIQLENVFASTIENNIINNSGSAGIIVISYDAGVKCLQGGETGQYGDQNGDNDCQGDITNNYIQNNTIKTDTYWGWGYGGIMDWYAGGLYAIGNTITSANGYGNGSINFQGTVAQVQGGVLLNNIITTKGVGICSQYANTFQQESGNVFNGTTHPRATGASCDNYY